MDSGESNRISSTRSNNTTRFRVFLASPSDVSHERSLAREAIDHISHERRFRDRIEIEIVAWDQPGAAVAMEAGLTPQDAIAQGLPKPEDCDLAVIVLWSRIGTQLPADFELKEDGSPYLSGTEWEYLNALKGYKTKRSPAVWVYRREGAPQFAINDPELSVKSDQWDKLQSFFAAFTNPDGSLAGGINYYQTPDDFRQQFEDHLRDRLDNLLETLPAADALQPGVRPTAPPHWTGSPYPGLEAFSPEQAPIFFGRGPEIDQLLQQFSNPEVHFVAIVGVSGSGKSSLVNAGLLPRLRSGIVGNAPWADLIFKPGERGGNPYLALAFALKSDLQIAGQTEQEIARALQADANIGKKHLTELLAQRPPATELLVVVDQFEELFTQTTADDRNSFLALLGHIVAQPRLRVIVTLRADFYARAIEEPTLANLLRRDRGTFPLDPPGMSAIHQMIIRPAEAAGVELEDGLAQRLLDDAGEGPGAMALIAFTLNQLYQREQSSRYLTIDAYEAFGGVQGAVQKRAETALHGLAVNTEIALPKLFANLVEVNEQEVATRRRAPQSLLKGDAKTVADALTEARLLVSGEGENRQATVEVAHETVLSGWERLSQWIRDHAEALRARRDLERVATEWDKSGRHGSALRSGKLLQRYLNAAEPRSMEANAYLTACKRRRIGFRIGYAIMGLLGFAMLAILFHVNKSDYPPTLAAKALFVQLGIWPVPEPQMVTIAAGQFQMGNPSEEGSSDERPVHTVRFAKPFEMGIYEVTFDEYDLFGAATGRKKNHDEGWTYDNNKRRGKLPVIHVSWNDAVAYAAWLSDRTGLNYRLPTEAEWEYAARAGTKTIYWWGDKVSKNHANCSGCGSQWDGKQAAPVGSFKPNPFGLYDTCGNLWEWLQDCRHENYTDAPLDGSAWEIIDDGDCSRRVLRGGSWFDVPRYVRSADRFGGTPAGRGGSIGFRLARTH